MNPLITTKTNNTLKYKYIIIIDNLYCHDSINKFAFKALHFYLSNLMKIFVNNILILS